MSSANHETKLLLQKLDNDISRFEQQATALLELADDIRRRFQELRTYLLSGEFQLELPFGNDAA